jgi:hypothetical protein
LTSEQSGKQLPEGRAKTLLVNLNKTCTDKGLSINATLQAQITSLISAPAIPDIAGAVP